MDSKLDREKILDFIFSIVLFRKSISLTEILSYYHIELAAASIDEAGLRSLLDLLVKDEKLVYGQDDLMYQINPVARDFHGYYADKLQGKSVAKGDKKRDNTWKVVPICLTIIFGISTFYFNYKNRKTQDTEKMQNNTIDSLKAVIHADSLNKLKIIKGSKARG